MLNVYFLVYSHHMFMISFFSLLLQILLWYVHSLKNMFMISFFFLLLQILLWYVHSLKNDTIIFILSNL
jgi:hypothetical protein